MTPDEKVIHDVSTFGWHVVKVAESDEGPGFAFTIGLTESYDHPEFIVFGLPPDTMHAVLNDIGALVKSGNRLRDGEESDLLLEDRACKFISFPDSLYKDHLGYALWFYKRRPFSVLQCAWPDGAGRYPWNPEMAPELRALQPVPKDSLMHYGP